VAFAARAALRVLPMVQRARKGLRGKHDFRSDIVLPVFRETGVAWSAAKYPAQATELSAAARAAAFAARATRDAAFAAQATADAAIAARAAANAAFAARPTAVAAVFAARATGEAYPDTPITVWAAVSIDGTRVEEGATASLIAGSPLWPQGQPEPLRSLWQEMKAALLAEKQDWQVWTNWYDDRLEGRVRDEERELAYVRIEEALWSQGPAIVNAEIKRRIEELEPPPEPSPAREGPLAEINNYEELEAWLRNQPREVEVAFAARMALRVLPLVARALPADSRKRGWALGGIVLPVFRATAVPWAAAKFSEFGAGAELRKAAHQASEAAHAADGHATAGTDADAFTATRTTDAADAAAAAAAHAVGRDEDNWVNARASNAAAAAIDAVTSTSHASHGSLAFWGAVSSDAASVVNGYKASALASLRLWPKRTPESIRQAWQELSKTLLDADVDWQVWTDWYEARLIGGASVEKLEVARVLIPDEIWVQGPAVVNPKINRLIMEHQPPGRRKKEPKPSSIPEIPPQRPAALEPVWSNGKLVLPSDPASADGDPDALVAALKVLRAEIAELADDADGEANIDKRSIIYLRRKAEGIPNYAPAQDELFHLAHAKEFLEGYARTVNKEWPDFLAHRFHALTLHFDRTVRQFPKWRDFVRNAQEDRLTAEQVAEVPALANAMISALREDEPGILIDPTVPSALEALQAPLQREIERLEQALDPIESGKLLLAEDIVESVDNIMKRIAEAALTIKNFGSEYGQKWKEGFAKEALSSAKKDGGKAFIWMKRTLIGIMTGTPALALLSQFGWLKPLLHFFGH